MYFSVCPLRLRGNPAHDTLSAGIEGVGGRHTVQHLCLCVILGDKIIQSIIKFAPKRNSELMTRRRCGSLFNYSVLHSVSKYS